MKNKGFLLSLFIAGSLTANAQDIKEWLSLTPIKMEKPALSHVKNVKDQVFTDAMLTDYSGVNIGSLVPDADSKENHFHRLRWTVAPMNRDTVTAGEKTDQPTLNYYAVYFSNSEWMSGSFHFRLFGQAEVYIDGVKKAGSADNKPVEKIVHGDWIPGKHTIIVKTATQGGNVLYANFKADTNSSLSVSLCPRNEARIFTMCSTVNKYPICLSPPPENMPLSGSPIP